MPKRTRAEDAISNELLNKIKELWDANLSKEKIAAQLNVEVWLLNKIRDKYRLNHRSGSRRSGEAYKIWSHDDDEQLKALYEDNKSKNKTQEIAQQLGRTVGSVHARISDLELGSKKIEWTPKEDSLLLSLRDLNNSTFGEISNRLANRSKNACYQRYKYIKNMEVQTNG